jgi:cytidylate kinase
MTVWTISAQAGSGGEEIARLLSERAGVPLVDSPTIGNDTTHWARSSVGRVASWFTEAGACAGSMFVATADLRVTQAEVPTERELSESMICEAARSPAVIADWSAFAILAEHPAACHVRLRAPLEWRIARYARKNCVPARVSEQSLRTLERRRCAYMRRRHGCRLDAPENFTLVCDASHLPFADLVEVLLIAARLSAGRRSPTPVSP